MKAAVGLEQEPQGPPALKVQVSPVGEQRVPLAFYESSLFLIDTFVLAPPDLIQGV